MKRAVVYIGMTNTPLRLKASEERELHSRVRARAARAEDARRASLILMLAKGQTYAAIQENLSCGVDYVRRWKQRFLEDGIDGLCSRNWGTMPRRMTPRLEAKILQRTRQAPSDGSTHWSSRKLAKDLGLSHMMIARVWRRAGIKPHRMDRYMASNDPDFETKAADVIGLYLHPPRHAAVFSVDEKTAIQALDRLDPVLPLSPGRAERHGFEYFRHGTLSLYAALDTHSGEVLGRTAARHTSEEFVAFLGEIVASQPPGKEIHVIIDNLSTHKTKKVQAFLEAHPNMRIHFTPTYSSWLNQVEIWFSKIERDVIARGVFISVKDLARKLMRYIRRYNRDPKPVRWTYRDPSRRITPASDVTGH